ncbi:hypothetical protein HMPREF0868_1498 [Mageeibacillus indolicus UPII9-5]|uniref:Uncharacterized protein n=1 Tax=Mageeibacillus indolicus (strain UPII9-5) TaxID=699246 RepID=D3QZ62_MAGIU|nr:hypothetical protein HMPREF0868_1498 [Mageeibacillus indolicus UPII9-5]
MYIAVFVLFPGFSRSLVTGRSINCCFPYEKMNYLFAAQTVCYLANT